MKKSLEIFRDNQLQENSNGINSSIASTKEHTLCAEQRNKNFQEIARCNYLKLPYDHITRILVEQMAMEYSKKLNFFPFQYSDSKCYISRMTLRKKSIYLDTHYVS